MNILCVAGWIAERPRWRACRRQRWVSCKATTRAPGCGQHEHLAELTTLHAAGMSVPVETSNPSLIINKRSGHGDCILLNRNHYPTDTIAHLKACDTGISNHGVVKLYNQMGCGHHTIPTPDSGTFRRVIFRGLAVYIYPAAKRNVE